MSVSQFFGKMKRSAFGFISDKRANVAILTGILAAPLFLAGGAAFDYRRLSNLESKMQEAADAAALAAAGVEQEMPKRELQRFVNRFFTANGGKAEVGRKTNVRGRYKSSNVVVRASVNANLYFLGAFRRDGSLIRVTSEAARSVAGVEMAMLIDNTASMNFGTTWSNTTSSIDRVIKEIEDQTASNEFYLTVLPYIDRMNIGKSRSSWLIPEVTNGSNPAALAQWEGCVEPLENATAKYPFNLDMGNPEGSFVPTVPGYWTGLMQTRGPKTHNCPTEIMGPSNKVDDIIADLRNLKPLKGTGRFDSALMWGWRAVSKQWKGKWGAGADYPIDTDERHKIVALFTDARTNVNVYEMEKKKGEFGNNNGSKTLFSHFEQICERMKAEDITVYIFHIVGNKHAKPYFERCAGDNYFEINNAPEFKTALSELSNLGTKLQLIR